MRKWFPIGDETTIESDKYKWKESDDLSYVWPVRSIK